MFKLIKWLIIIAIIGLIVAYFKGYKIDGKTVKEHATSIMGSDFDEGVQDIRVLVGEAVKAVGSAITPGVTEDEKKELENVIKQEIQKGEKVKQETLPPVKN